MSAPPIPTDEPERLATLRSLGLLDTAAEERFDRIARLAQLLLDVPVALISLVDADRVWFKSRRGLTERELPRASSFCAHVLVGEDVLEVPDTTRDERFRDNPLVTGGPGVRFYAGAPLAAPDGRRVGTLCVSGREPRTLTDAQRRALKELAALAEHELAAAFPRAPSTAAADAAAASAARHASRDRWMQAGFAAALALMLTAAAASYRGARKLAAAARDVPLAQETLRGLPGAPGTPARLAAVAKLQAAEESRLAERRARVDDLARTLIVVAALARCVGALVVLLAYLAVRRHNRERALAEAALVEARDAALRDADALRQAQEEVRRQSDRLRAVLDHVDSGVIMIDANGSISLFNLAAERIHGAWRDELERVMRSGTHPPMRADEKTPLTPEEDPAARALKGETVRDARIFLRTPFRPNGYAIVAGSAPLRNPQGLITGAVLIFREA